MPGTVAGLTMALQKYGSGKFKLSQLIAPAIELARNGYKVGDEFEETGTFVDRADGALALDR